MNNQMNNGLNKAPGPRNRPVRYNGIHNAMGIGVPSHVGRRVKGLKLGSRKAKAVGGRLGCLPLVVRF